MSVEVIEKHIDGHDIMITQFHAIRGIKIKARLYKLLLPVVSPLLGSLDLKDAALSLESNLDFSKVLPQAFVSLSETLDENVFIKLLLDLLQGVRVDGKEVNEQAFDQLFIANYNLAYKLAYEVVMANHFFDFGGILNLLPTQAEKTVIPSK